jgi:hypothetical protein
MHPHLHIHTASTSPRSVRDRARTRTPRGRRANRRTRAIFCRSVHLHITWSPQSREARRTESDLDSWSHAVSSRSDDQYAGSEDLDSPMTRLDSRAEREERIWVRHRTHSRRAALSHCQQCAPPHPHRLHNLMIGMRGARQVDLDPSMTRGDERTRSNRDPRAHPQRRARSAAPGKTMARTKTKTGRRCGHKEQRAAGWVTSSSGSPQA